MPAYHFRHKETNEFRRILCSYDDLEKEKKQLGDDWVQEFSINLISGTGFGMYSKIDDGMKDRLKAIKKANPGSTIKI